MTDVKPFWDTKPLSDMTQNEWESLCDGCAKCCVIVLQDDDTGQYHRTNIACKLLNLQTKRCNSYAARHMHVPACVQLTAQNVDQLKWMPESCSYRRLAEGRGLPDWHPLITGDPKSTHKSGNGVGPLVSERLVPEEDWENYVIEEDDGG